MGALTLPEPRGPWRPSGGESVWFGKETPFTVEAVDDAPVAHRLLLPEMPGGGWIVLTYRGRAVAGALRPVLRVQRRDGADEAFVLPGAAQGVAHWLGHLPHDVSDLRLAIDPRSGVVIERVGRRSRASLVAQCLLQRPLRAAPALYHAVRGNARRVRDSLRGSCGVVPIGRYRHWSALRAGADEEPPPETTIRLILPARRGDAAAVAQTVAGLRAQTFRDWSLVIAWSGGEPGADADARIAQVAWSDAGRLGDLSGEAAILGVLSPGDVLTGDALAVLARSLAGPHAAQVAYGDAVRADGTPRLKPDWSPDYALARGYQGTPALYTGAVLTRLAGRRLGPAADFLHDLALAASAGMTPDAVAHVPRVLCRVSSLPETDPRRAEVLERHLAETGSPARVVSDAHGTDLLWPLPAPAPLVTVVIPSRDRLALIERSSRGVLHETAYPAIELIIVDNGSTDADVRRYYDTLRADPRVRITDWPAAFNFSAMINAGVALARGEIVLLLNNDVAVLDPGWLEALVRQAARPEVGAVGAKLLYENGTLQHAGVVVGLGGRAGHILRRRPGDSPGHLGQMLVAHEVSAVTAACLAVSKVKFDAVGGLDAEAFPVDFNDVDVCLRLNAAGYKTVWTPKAVLAHLESTSRGATVGAARVRFEAEAARFTERWSTVIRHDPFYHPALSLTTFGEDLE